MATVLGKWLRKKRIDRGETLFVMARGLGMTSANLSAIELGKRKPAKDFYAKLVDYLESPPEEQNELRVLIAKEQKEVIIHLAGRSQGAQDVAVAFARKLPELSEDDFLKLKKMLGV